MRDSGELPQELADADPPTVLIAMQFPAADGTRVSSQLANSWKHPAQCIGPRADLLQGLQKRTVPRHETNSFDRRKHSASLETSTPSVRRSPRHHVPHQRLAPLAPKPP